MITIAIFPLHTTMREEILFVQFCQKIESAVTESNNFNGRSVSRGGWFAFVSCFLRGAHLVHPSAAIGFVTAKYKACLWMHTNLIVESAIGHVFVDTLTSVALTEAQTLEVNCQCLLYDIRQRLILRAKLYLLTFI